MNAFTDVIAAVSTPPGKGGVAVIRMSGDGALVIADKVFSARNGSSLSSAAPRRQIYGYIKDKNTVIDDVMACYFSAPASYTGEDTVEIYCHGGMLVTRTVLELLLRHGAVAAQAGEFKYPRVDLHTQKTFTVTTTVTAEELSKAYRASGG